MGENRLIRFIVLIYHNSHNTMEQSYFRIPSKYIKFPKTFFSVVYLDLKDFWTVTLFLGNSGNFPFSINFWSIKFCEICIYFHSNKQNNTPHKCLRRFMITLTNLSCSSFLSRCKLQNCVATNSYKPKCYCFTKCFI